MKNYEVYLSPLAELKLDLLLQYLELKWGSSSKNSFLDKLEDISNQLSAYPKSFPESKVKEGIYKCVVTTQTSLYYRIRSESIEIITLIDNRQDPKKIKDEISERFRN